MSERVLVPVTELQRGFDNCVSHIRRLIQSSEILYSNKLFHSAFSMAVLAIEEDAKLGEIQDHIRNNKPILRSDWHDLTRGGSHKLKLIMQLQKERMMFKTFPPDKFASIQEFNKQMGIKDVAFHASMRDRPEDYAAFQLLDTLKQDCFYLGWRNNNWSSFSSAFTEEEQEAMTWLLIRQARSWLLPQIIANRHPNPVQSSDMSRVKDDPIVREFLDLNKEFGTDMFVQRTRLLSQALKKYRQR